MSAGGSRRTGAFALRRGRTALVVRISADLVPSVKRIPKGSLRSTLGARSRRRQRRKVHDCIGRGANNVPIKFEWSPWDTEFGNFVGTQLASAAAGKQSWSKALANTQSQLVSYAQSAGYTVSG